MSPFQVISWPFDKIADSAVSGTESAIKNVARYHRLKKWTILRLICILGLLLAISISTGFPTAVLPLWLVTVYYAGSGASAMLMRANAYRSGWMDGRVAMLGSMSEAIRRNMEIGAWVQAEIERDAAMIAASTGAEVTVTVERIYGNPEDDD